MVGIRPFKINKVYLYIAFFSFLLYSIAPLVLEMNVIPHNINFGANIVEIKDKNDNIDLVYEGGKKENIELSYSLRTDENFKVIVDLKNIDYQDKTIGLCTNYLDYQCIIDGKVFYENKSPKYTMPKSNGGIIYTLIDLPKKISDTTLTIEFFPRLIGEHRYRINQIEICNRGDFFLHMINKDFKGIIFVIFLFIIFIICMDTAFVSYKNKITDSRVFNLGIISLIASIYFFIRTKSAVYFLSEYRALIYFLDYVTFIFMPYPLLKLVENVVDEKFDKYIKFATNLICANYFIQLILTFLKISEFKEMLYITWGVLFFVSILTLVSTFCSRKTKKMTRKKLILSILPLQINVLYGVIQYITKGNIMLDNIFIILWLIISQIYLYMNSYVNIIDEN